MRADPGARAALGLAIAGGACLFCRLAAAEAIPVDIEVRYQHADAAVQTTSLWSRHMNVAYARRLSPTLQLSGQFRLDALDYLNRPEKSLIPYGALQVAHPFAGFTASYRPSRSTNTVAITTQQNEAQVSAFLAPARLPRVDVQWTSRAQRIGEVLSPGTGITRSGRLRWELGGLELRGGAGDLRVDPNAVSTQRLYERNWDTGVGFRTLRGGWNLHADAGVGEVRRGAGDGLLDLNRSEDAVLEISRRLSRRMDLAVNYQYRGIELSTGPGPHRYASHDGAATWTLRPTLATQLLVAGGVQPVNSGKNSTLAFAHAAASAEGRVRAGWIGLGSVSQTFNGHPGGHLFRVGTYRAGSRLLLTRGLRLNLDGTLTAGGDTLSRDQRTTFVDEIGVTADPLPRLSLTGNLKGYRSGRGLTHPSAHSLTRTLDVRWRPSAAIDLDANLTGSGVLPTGHPTLSTERFNVRVSPSGKLQAEAQYNRSNHPFQDTGVGRLKGLEVWTGRILAGLGRRFRVTLGGSISDPGTPVRDRELDASVSMRLGGPS